MLSQSTEPIQPLPVAVKMPRFPLPEKTKTTQGGREGPERGNNVSICKNVDLFYTKRQ